MSGAGATAADVERLLASLGFPAARVRLDGPRGEVAMVSLPESLHGAFVERGRELAGEVRRLGVGYLALDLDPGTADG